MRPPSPERSSSNSGESPFPRCVGFSSAIMTTTRWHASCWNSVMGPMRLYVMWNGSCASFPLSLVKNFKADCHVILFLVVSRCNSVRKVHTLGITQNTPLELHHFVTKDGKVLLVDFAQAVAHRCNNAMSLYRDIDQRFCIGRTRETPTDMTVAS